MTKQAYVIGHYIGHSKSPLIHNYWLNRHHISGRYDILDVAPTDLVQTIDTIKGRDEVMGCNVTIPHKQNVMAALDEIDDTARAIGAVNTVYKNGGQLIGSNTDAFGFIENLKQNITAHEYEAAKKGRVHIYGAGGAAKAIIYGLIKDGFTDISIENRTREKAEECIAPYKKQVQISVRDQCAKDNLAKDISLVINTTSLGMTGHPPFNPDLSGLNEVAIIVDIVYNPLYTELLTTAKKRGLKTVTGIGMLLHQARPAFEHFFGICPQIDKTLEELVLG